MLPSVYYPATARLSCQNIHCLTPSTASARPSQTHFVLPAKKQRSPLAKPSPADNHLIRSLLQGTAHTTAPSSKKTLHAIWSARQLPLCKTASLIQKTLPAASTLPLSQYAVSLADLPEALRSMHTAKDEGFSQLHKTFVHNGKIDPTLVRRKGKWHEDPSSVHFPEQDFILAPLPKKTSTAAYFRKCLEEKVRVFVSAHEISDANILECGKFWAQPVLSTLNLGGWKLKIQNIRVLAVGTKQNGRGELPQLEETTILASHDQHPQRIMTHIHHQGWIDRTVAPDESLLGTVLDRMEELSPNPRNPIAINCHAGRGRTLNVAVAYFIRKQIALAHQQGLDTNDIYINVPELMFRFHRQRDLDIRSGPPIEYAFALFKQFLSITETYARTKLP